MLIHIGLKEAISKERGMQRTSNQVSASGVALSGGKLEALWPN